MTRVPKSQPPQSFEAAMTELESIVASMESGKLPLEQSLQAYRRGAELMKYCQGTLQEVQQQVRILEADTLVPYAPDEDGGR